MHELHDVLDDLLAEHIKLEQINDALNALRQEKLQEMLYYLKHKPIKSNTTIYTEQYLAA